MKLGEVVFVKKYIILASVLTMMVITLLGFNAMRSLNENTDQQYITLEQFNQIEDGMTYEDLKKILKTSGEIQSESGDKDSDSNVLIYTFTGKAEDSKAIVMLRGDKVISKSNIGLE